MSKHTLDLEHNSRRAATAPVGVADKANSLNMEMKILFSFSIYPFFSLPMAKEKYSLGYICTNPQVINIPIKEQ